MQPQKNAIRKVIGLENLLSLKAEKKYIQSIISTKQLADSIAVLKISIYLFLAT